MPAFSILTHVFWNFKDSVTSVLTFVHLFMHPFILLKTRQQAQSGVAYAKPPVPKLRVNLITGSALPEMKLLLNASSYALRKMRPNWNTGVWSRERFIAGPSKENRWLILKKTWTPWWCYLKNWVDLLVGVEPKDTTKPKSRRRKDLLLAASKENTGDLSQSRVSWNSKIGEVLS